MIVSNRRKLYFLFFVSGFCSLVYQVVWTRLAFASFGIITPVLSVVLSVFMLGLSVGSWAGGQLIGGLARKTGLSAIFFYGAAEMIIGVGAFATPRLFALGQQCLLAAGQMDSFRYLLLSALVLAASILPWCICMGATFPFMMAYMREHETKSTDSFSYLYFANVLGAMTGTILTALVLVEVMGFHYTLVLAAAGNFAIAALSVYIGCAEPFRGAVAPVAGQALDVPPGDPARGVVIRWILFTTGFCAMAMEVVWTRTFTPVLKTQVYSFALILFTYLGATFLGSLLYRRNLRRNGLRPLGELMAMLGLTVFFPIIGLDQRILSSVAEVNLGKYLDATVSGMIVLASICPFCAVLGYLTPSLIDRFADGHPAAAGKAYGINVVGCILGPLCASYLLLPRMSERGAMVVLGLPLLGLGFLCRKSLSSRRVVAVSACVGAALIWSLLFAQIFESALRAFGDRTIIRRDYAASVASFGAGFDRRLLVNGIDMTGLGAEPKFMVHLPMAMHNGPPRSALIICFGMGTSYRAALSWDVPTTAVELVPSVVDAFGFYHADTAKVLANPLGRIFIDDGRRYLERTREKYDVIVIDPPPPPEAAGSSLLYSREFYDLAKEHLNTNGILQMWCPDATLTTLQAVARSLFESFPYTRVYGGIKGHGTHFLESMHPMKDLTALELCARMPPKARDDLTEWMDIQGSPNLIDYIQAVVSKEAPASYMLNPHPGIQITDDQPFNEYYLLREWGAYAP